MRNTNFVELVGKIVTSYLLDHEYNGEKYYHFLIEVVDESGHVETFPIIAPDSMVDVGINPVGKLVYVRGAFRSFTTWPGHKTNLLLYVAPNEICFVDENKCSNQITLEGFVCAKPEFTILDTGRIMAHMLLAVNRHEGKADYVPCIAYEQNAISSSQLDSGDLISIKGRISSKDTDPADNITAAYQVKIDDMKTGVIYTSEYDFEVNLSYRRWVSALDVDRDWIGLVPAYEVYSYYVGFCNHNRYKSMSKNLFYKTMINDFYLGNTV